MGKRALKKSVEQLQQIFDVLGEYGGTIETKKPENWWTLDLEVVDIDGDKKDIMIGVFKEFNGDIMFDPQIKLTLTMGNGKVVDAEIHEFSNTTIFGTSVVDADGMLHMNGMTEKSPQGLRGLFEGFMNNMVEQGPYLKDPKKVTKYTKALTD